MKTFTLTTEHIALLTRMQVGWCDDEFGAPEIDPKRPYGNGDVLDDIHEILAPEDPPLDDLSRVDREALEARYRALHKETQTALQVVLAAGLDVEPGGYYAGEYTNDWHRDIPESWKWPQ